MKPYLVKLTLMSSCALLAMPAVAQHAEQPRRTAETTPAKAPASATPAFTVAAAAKTTTSAATATVAAAGSVLILADGIVANATLAQIQPPAPGFVYER